jgi:hypothetical protein
VYSKLEETVTLTLWVVDDHHFAGNRGWFARRIKVEPGENRFEILLSEIRETARHRELDMTRIHKVDLYAKRTEEPFSLFLDDFRLK